MPAKRKYDPMFHPKLARKLALLGASNEQIADVFEVTEKTVQNWAEKHEEFGRMLNAGKMVADAEVANSLYRRAVGYRHKATKIFLHEGKPVIVPYTEVYAPDTAAAGLWLRNRQRDLWRDKVDVDLKGKGNGRVTITMDMSGNGG